MKGLQEQVSTYRLFQLLAECVFFNQFIQCLVKFHVVVVGCADTFCKMLSLHPVFVVVNVYHSGSIGFHYSDVPGNQAIRLFDLPDGGSIESSRFQQHPLVILSAWLSGESIVQGLSVLAPTELLLSVAGYVGIMLSFLHFFLQGLQLLLTGEGRCGL